MAYVPSITFRESPLGPWGAQKGSSVQLGKISKRGTPPAQKRPTEAIGCISDVNEFITQKSKLLEADNFEEDMSTKKSFKRRSKSKEEQSKDNNEEADPTQPSKCADTQLIEMAAYPGYSPEKPSPLPHNIDPLEQMRRVTRAHAKLSTKARNFREAWCHLFYSKYSQDIFLDYYWWFFLHRYQPGHHVSIQDCLFTRISENYVKLLCQPVEIKWRDTHFKMYPDAIAQCVYSTFICAYPNSWNNFDEVFKNELSLCITLWQVGTRPLPGLWTKWNLSLLEPQNLLKSVGKETETDKTLPQRPPETDVNKPMEGEKKSTEENDGVPNHEFKRLSIEEVRKTLQGSSETWVPLVRHSHREQPGGGKIVPSASEEKRIGLAREQFQALEKKANASQEPQQVVSESHMSQCRSDPILPSQGNSRLDVNKCRQTPRPEIVVKPALSYGTSSKITIKANIQTNFSKFTAPGFKSTIQSSNTPKEALQPYIRVPRATAKNSTDSSACKVYKPAIQPSGISPRPQANISSRVSDRDSQTSKQTAKQLPHLPVRPQSGARRIIQIQKIRNGSKIHPSPRVVKPLNKNSKHSKNPKCNTTESPTKPALSPADELIYRAKAKIGILKGKKTNSKIGQSRVWLKAMPKNPIASNQATAETNSLKTEDQRSSAAALKDKTSEWPMLHAKHKPPSAIAMDNIGSQQQNTVQSGGKSQAEDSGTPKKEAAVVKALSGMRSSQVAQKTSDTQKVASSASTTPSKSYQQAYTELKDMAYAFKGQSTEEILSSIKGPEFEHVLFNFHGHSPLVKHYINNIRRTHISEKESIVGRTEIIDDQPEKAICYKEILAESKRTSEKNHTMFQRYYELQKQVLSASTKKRLDDKHKHEENVKLVLANKREVQQLSNELTLCAAQKKDLDRVERTKAIQKVLDRVISH